MKCRVQQCSAVQYNEVQSTAVQYDEVQGTAVQCSTVKCRVVSTDYDMN